jgi:hypothetical protein
LSRNASETLNLLSLPEPVLPVSDALKQDLDVNERRFENDALARSHSIASTKPVVQRLQEGGSKLATWRMSLGVSEYLKCASETAAI